MSHLHLTRRAVLGGILGLGVANRAVGQQPVESLVFAPIGFPGQPAGMGFQIGHGFACENSWFAPGWWHTGEDWYAIDGDTGGASVYAMETGEVVYADFDYPGRVVIVQHEPDLFSVYGHLDYQLAVSVGSAVTAGDVLGTVLAQSDVRGPGQAPSHLHVELRTFLTRDDVNGSSPRYGVNCGFQCPPGPGYWPMNATEHPAELGWRNPLLGWLDRLDVTAFTLVPQASTIEPLRIYTEPEMASAMVAEIDPGDAENLAILGAETGDPADRTTATSAEAYNAWLGVETGEGKRGWLQWAIPSVRETGIDGRPSAVDLPFVLDPTPR